MYCSLTRARYDNFVFNQVKRCTFNCSKKKKKKKILGYVRWCRTVVCLYLILMVVIKKNKRN